MGTLRDPLLSESDSGSDSEIPRKPIPPDRKIISYSHEKKQASKEKTKDFKYVPGLSAFPYFPSLSSLDKKTHSACLKVLAAEDTAITSIPLKPPNKADLEIFEAHKEIIVKEQKEFVECAKRLWLSNQCVRVLKHPALVEAVEKKYLEEQSAKIRQLPQNYEFYEVINISSATNVELIHRQSIFKVENVPHIRIPRHPKTHLSPDPEFWQKRTHTSEISTSDASPRSELVAYLSGLCLELDVEVVAAGSALCCLQDNTSSWIVPVTVMQNTHKDGKPRKNIVLEGEIQIPAPTGTSKMERAYTQLLRELLTSCNWTPKADQREDMSHNFEMDTNDSFGDAEHLDSDVPSTEEGLVTDLFDPQISEPSTLTESSSQVENKLEKTTSKHTKKNIIDSDNDNDSDSDVDVLIIVEEEEEIENQAENELPGSSVDATSSVGAITSSVGATSSSVNATLSVNATSSSVGAKSSSVGATSSSVGATSSSVGATSSSVGATSSSVGATSSSVGATSSSVGATSPKSANKEAYKRKLSLYEEDMKVNQQLSRTYFGPKERCNKKSTSPRKPVTPTIMSECTNDHTVLEAAPNKHGCNRKYRTASIELNETCDSDDDSDDVTFDVTSVVQSGRILMDPSLESTLPKYSPSDSNSSSPESRGIKRNAKGMSDKQTDGRTDLPEFNTNHEDVLSQNIFTSEASNKETEQINDKAVPIQEVDAIQCKAESIKSRAEPTKQNVEPTKHKMEPTKHKVEPTKNKVETTEHKVEPTKHKVEATKHKVEPTKHKVEPTKQKVEPTKNKVEPTIQKVEPTKHKVEPTKHKVEPTIQKVEPTKQKVEPTKNKVEPTIQKVEPTKQKVEPTKNKVEPTIQKVEPTKHKVEPTKHKVEPTKQKLEPTKHESAPIKHKVELMKRKSAAIKHKVGPINVSRNENASTFEPIKDFAQRRFDKWELCTPDGKDNISMLVHCSERLRKADGSVLAVPVLEYQWDVAAATLPRRRARALALHLRGPHTQLLTARLNPTTSELLSLEFKGVQRVLEAEQASLSSCFSLLQRALAALRRLSPGNYLLRHDAKQTFSNIFIYKECAAFDQKAAPDFVGHKINLHGVSLSNESSLGSPVPAPSLCGALLPWHRHRQILPLLFMPSDLQQCQQHKELRYRDQKKTQKTAMVTKKKNKKKKKNK